MNSNILLAANLRARKQRPNLPSQTICEIFQSGNLLELGFLSGRCSRDKRGTCLMCDYGAAEKTFTLDEYLREMDRALEKYGQGIEVLLLCTNGSFFDERQISSELFQAIVTRAAKSRVPLVEIETHYLDVTREKLGILKEVLKEKRVAIEMGLETVDQFYQSNIIMKGICLSDYERAISMIQSFGFATEVNIMVGLPFLSAKEQFDFSLNTIRWAFCHDCHIVLFPMNIKPYTLLMDMYHSGHYCPVSQWMLPLLLDVLSVPELEKVTVAWFGNREEVYSASTERAVFPVACPSCSAVIKQFYKSFLGTQSGKSRKALLTRLLQQNCECLDRTKRAITLDASESLRSRYENYISYLRKFSAREV